MTKGTQPPPEAPLPISADGESKKISIGKTWIILGVLAVILGIASGLVMSTATFIK